MTTAHVPFGTDTIIIDPPPVIPPPVVPVASPPINVTADNVTIADKAFSGTPGTGYGIQAIGTATKTIKNLTIRRCTFSGFNTAIYGVFVDNLIVEDCTIDGPLYAGVLLFSVVGGSVSRNAIRHIGPQNLSSGDGNTNAYGIAFSSQGTNRVSSDMTADANVIEDIPSWMGINTHSGVRLTWTNNICRRVRRAYFLAPFAGTRIVNCRVTGNRAEALLPGTLDPTAFFIENSDGCAVTGNFISTTYKPDPDGGEWLNYVRDYLAASKTLTRSGNVLG